MKVFKLYCISVCLFIATFLSSYPDGEYHQAIPKSSTALVSLDVSKISGVDSTTLLKILLRMKNLNESGIDLTHRICLFESPGGNLGIYAKMQDKGRLEQIFIKMSSNPARYRETYFTQINDSWVAGYNDQSLLVMEPLPPTVQKIIKGTMAKYLRQDEENSVIASPMFEKLENISSPMAMVAQAEALPEQLVIPMTLDTPEGVDESQVLVAAEMSIEKRCLTIQGRPFSFSQRINQEIEEPFKVYRPITDVYLQSMPNEALLSMFVSIDGQKFLLISQHNKGLQVLLIDISQAIDMDNIVHSVDGDMCIIVPNYSEGAIQLSMVTRLVHTGWLADIPYRKQSVPQGAKSTDAGKNIYSYSDDETNFCFGMSEDKQFLNGSSKQETLASIGQAKTPLPEQLQKQIKGQKMIMVIRFDDVRNETMEVFVDLLKPVFGPVNTVVYKLKQKVDTITLNKVPPHVFTHVQGLVSDVQNEEITFHKGHYYLLKASSGEGKGTSCSYLIGYRRDFGGTILFDKQNINAPTIKNWVKIRTRQVNYLFQGLRLFSELAALKNIMTKNNMTHLKAKAQIFDWFEELGVADKVNARIRQTSFGQRQRVALICSLIQPFDFLLADEPISHLDDGNSDTMAQVLSREAAQQGAGVIVTNIGKHLVLEYDRVVRL